VAGGPVATTTAPAGATHTGQGASGQLNHGAPRNGNWTNSQLEGALCAHEQGCSVNGAAALFEIPRISFLAHLTGTVLSRKRGAALFLVKQRNSSW
jgi:hypothetical protein